MLRLNCLLRNAEILPNLTDIVRFIGYELAGNGKKASIATVYNVVRKSGLEADIQTVSYIYENTFDLNDTAFSNQDEIDEAREQTYRDLFELEAEDLKFSKLGKDKQVVAVVEKIISAVKLIGEKSTSVSRLFQDRLAKYARRVTKLKPEQIAKKTTEEILREVLMLEQPNDFYGLGVMENAQSLFEELQEEFDEAAQLFEQKDDVYNADKLRQYNEILQEASYKFLMSAPEIQQVINDTLKEAGYTKKMNTKAGEREIVDWNKVMSAADLDFTDVIRDVFSKKGFTETEVDRIAEFMVDEFNSVRAAKMERALDVKNKDVTKPQKSNAVKRLANLYQLGIFSSANQNALFRLLGVSQVSQNNINKLQNLMKVYNAAIQQPITQWSSSYIRTIQREIENIIEQSEESKDGAVNLVRKWSFFNQLNNALLLSNPQNLIENASSGMFQFLMTSLTNPKDAIAAANVAANVFSDVIRGGVREGHELYNTFNSSGNLEDRYNFETAKTIGEKITSYATFIPRAALSSVDNSIKAGLVHEMGTNILRKVLVKQGATKEEANILMNEIFYGNKKEIGDVADQLESNLIAMGIKIAKGKANRLAAEMAWGNMLTDGQFFHDTLERLQQAGEVNKQFIPSINKDLLESIRNAAETAAAKGLGHQSDSMILQFLDQWAQLLGKGVTEARQRGGEGLATAELARNIYANVNRYRPGSLRWWWLSFEKASGLAILQTLVTDVLMGKARAYNFDRIDLGDTNKNIEEHLQKYLSLRQRLVRETFSPVFTYFAGNLIIAQLLKAFGDDDDDKEKRLLNLAKWMVESNSRKRWLQKTLPPRTFNYLTSLAWIDKQGKIQTKKLKDVTGPEELSLKAETEQFLQNFMNNYSQSTIQKSVESMGNLFRGERAGVPAGEFVGTFFNLGGPLRAYQLWKDAIFGNPRMSSSEWQKIRPENFGEGFLHQTVNRELYESIVK